MFLLAFHARRRLTSVYPGPLGLQFVLWIVCAVYGEEQPFSVEVRKALASQKHSRPCPLIITFTLVLVLLLFLYSAVDFSKLSGNLNG